MGETGCFSRQQKRKQNNSGAYTSGGPTAGCLGNLVVLLLLELRTSMQRASPLASIALVESRKK